MMQIGEFSSQIEIKQDWRKSMKFTIDCAVHGEGAQSYANGRCILCVKQKEIDDQAQLIECHLDNIKSTSNIHPDNIGLRFDGYKPYNSKAKEVLNTCKNFDFKSDMLFIGKPGTGKTHLSCALLDKAIRMGLKCRYEDFYEIHEIEENNLKLFDFITKCDFLVIDEFGRKSKISKYMPDDPLNEDLLFRIINKRRQNQVKTLVITNLNGETFKKSISDSLYSRLKLSSIECLFDWEDYRLKGVK